MNTETTTISKTPQTGVKYVHSGMYWGIDYKDEGGDLTSYLGTGLYETVEFVQVSVDTLAMQTTLTDRGVEYYTNECNEHFQSKMFEIPEVGDSIQWLDTDGETNGDGDPYAYSAEVLSIVNGKVACECFMYGVGYMKEFNLSDDFHKDIIHIEKA